MRVGSHGEQKRGFCFCSENRIPGCPSEKTRVRGGLLSSIPAGGFGAVCGRPHGPDQDSSGCTLIPRPNSLLRTCGWCGPRHCRTGEERRSSRQGPDQGFRDRAGTHGREGVSVPAVPGSRARPHAGTVLPHPPDPAGPVCFVPAWGRGWEEGQIPPYGRRAGARPHGTNSCAARCAFWAPRAGGRPEHGRQMRAGCLTDRCPAGGAAV